MMVLFTWKRKLAWAAAFINFPFLFSPTTCLSWHGEGPFWAQQVVLCAWHHLKLVQVSGGLFAALPLRMFADPKKQLCLTRFFSCLRRALFSLTFSFFFFPRGKTLIETRANSKKQIQDLFSMATYTVHIYLIQITQTSKVSQHIQYVRQRKYKLENGVCRAELLNSST